MKINKGYIACLLNHCSKYSACTFALIFMKAMLASSEHCSIPTAHTASNKTMHSHFV